MFLHRVPETHGKEGFIRIWFWTPVMCILSCCIKDDTHFAEVSETFSLTIKPRIRNDNYLMYEEVLTNTWSGAQKFFCIKKRRPQRLRTRKRTESILRACRGAESISVLCIHSSTMTSKQGWLKLRFTFLNRAYNSKKRTVWRENFMRVFSGLKAGGGLKIQTD